jgi:hypothetical protein
LLWQIIAIFHHALQIYLEVGLSSNNSLRFINVRKLADKLGSRLSKALTGLHSFTGCDQSPAFAKRVKIRPLTILEKNDGYYQKAFGSLGSSEEISATIISQIEMFVCELYEIKQKNCEIEKPSVNDARLQLFTKVYQVNTQCP